MKMVGKMKDKVCYLELIETPDDIKNTASFAHAIRPNSSIHSHCF